MGSASLYLIIKSPNDYEQGWIAKILYIHVASAWISILFFTLLGLSSLIWLIWKWPQALTLNSAILPILILAASLALITGSLWGKLAWGVAWVFDGRLTSMAFLLLAALLYKLIEQNKGSDKLKGWLGVINLIGVPIVKYSVVWWSSLHQSSTLTLTKSTLDPQLAHPLLLTLAFITLLSALILELIYRSIILTARIEKYQLRKE